jgi:hypothetical protein
VKARLRGRSAFRVAFKTDTVAPNPESRGFTDVADAQAQGVTPVGFERRCRIMPGGDQLAAQRQHRRAAGCRDARRNAGVAADEFGEEARGIGEILGVWA